MAYSLAWLDFRRALIGADCFSIRAVLVGSPPTIVCTRLKKATHGSTQPLFHGLLLIEATARNRLAQRKS
jgi:hypothetical protein